MIANSMKKFEFKLDSALRWRSAQMKAQDLYVQTLERDRTILEGQLRALNEDYARAEESARTGTNCGGDTLAALSRYRLSFLKLSANLSLRLNQLAATIEKQRIALLKVTRDYELLVKLEKQELRQWETESNRRDESDASEAFLIRWNRK